MEKDIFNVFDEIEGLEPVDPKVLEEFSRVMTDVVIPEIVQVMQERARLAAESRKWILGRAPCLSPFFIFMCGVSDQVRTSIIQKMAAVD